MEGVKSNKKQEFWSIDEGNQNELLVYSTISQEWIDSTQANFDWENCDEYDNRMCEYMEKLFDDVVENSGIQDSRELWEKLNRQQKVFWVFLSFHGNTLNGGVYQFIFNRPEFILATAEMLKELGMENVSNDYNEVLRELSGKIGKIIELKSGFNDDAKTWAKRWKSFSDGREELKTTEIIENYYYDKEFQKGCQKKMSDYIELNMDKFRKLKEG